MSQVMDICVRIRHFVQLMRGPVTLFRRAQPRALPRHRMHCSAHFHPGVRGRSNTLEMLSRHHSGVIAG